jgi:aldose 1-epimerase
MYSAIHNAHAVVLQSDTSRIEIWPSCGAILNKWEASFENGIVRVIEGYDDHADFRNHCENKGFRSCKLSPYVCRISHGAYEFEGQQHHIGKFKLGTSSIHGLVYDADFDVLVTEASSEHALVVLKHHYAGTDAGYPYPFDLVVTYLLQHNNRITVSTSFTNRSPRTVPMADGWHPYFQLNRSINELHLQIASRQRLEFNDALIPTGILEDYPQFECPTLLGDTFFDNCFLLPNPLQGAACVLINKENGVALSIFPDETYPYLQIYTPPSRQSIAIENLSGAPDCFNNRMGLILAEPGEQLTFTTEWHCTEWQGV